LNDKGDFMTSQEATIDWDEQNARFSQWVQDNTDKARRMFQGIDREVQKETDAFRNRTAISVEELHKPFTV
jgi:hypothetical protein